MNALHFTKTLLFPGMLLLCTGMILPATGCTDLSEYDRNRVEDAITDSLLYATRSSNISMALMQEGLRRVSVESPHAVTYTLEGETRTELEDSVQVWVYGPDGEVTTRVKSRSATYYGRQSEFHFSGNVKVETVDGKKLFTDYLEWSHQDRNIFSSGFVIVVTATDSITGYGLRGNENLDQYTLTEVTGEFELERPVE